MPGKATRAHAPSKNMVFSQKDTDKNTHAVMAVASSASAGLKAVGPRTDISFKSPQHVHTSPVSNFNRPLPFYGSLPPKPINPRATMQNSVSSGVRPGQVSPDQVQSILLYPPIFYPPFTPSCYALISTAAEPPSTVPHSAGGKARAQMQQQQHVKRD